MLDKYIELAYSEALKAKDKNEVPVGAVIVKDGIVLAKAHNLRITKSNALYHAETMAIEKACKMLASWRLDGCVLYTTLEPCIMCAGAILQSRMEKVVFTSLDAKFGCVVSQYTLFDDNLLGHRVSYEYREDIRSKLLLQEFFKDLRKN